MLMQANLLMERQQQLLWGLSFLQMVRNIEEDAHRNDSG